MLPDLLEAKDPVYRIAAACDACHGWIETTTPISRPFYCCSHCMESRGAEHAGFCMARVSRGLRGNPRRNPGGTRRRNPTIDYDTRDEILAGIARALFVSAYAYAHEEGEIDGPRPGPQEDWMDYAPETPLSAKAAAVDLADQVERLNSETLDALWVQNAHAELDSQQFGHYLAMQALGHGVGLRDYDIDDVHVPHFEFYL